MKSKQPATVNTVINRAAISKLAESLYKRTKLELYPCVVVQSISSFCKPFIESFYKSYQKLGVNQVTRKECENLLTIYKDLADQKMDRQRFRDLLHNIFNLTEDVILDQLFRTFDTDSDGCVSPEEWLLNLSVFLRGDLDEKIKFVFKVYDLDGNGSISKDEMLSLLKNSLFKQPTEDDPEEGTRDLIELIMKKMDHDHDGKVSLDDFSHTVKNDSLLLEAFGTCLPDNETRNAFTRSFAEDNNASGYDM